MTKKPIIIIIALTFSHFFAIQYGKSLEIASTSQDTVDQSNQSRETERGSQQKINQAQIDLLKRSLELEKSDAEKDQKIKRLREQLRATKANGNSSNNTTYYCDNAFIARVYNEISGCRLPDGDNLAVDPGNPDGADVLKRAIQERDEEKIRGDQLAAIIKASPCIKLVD